MTAPVTRPRLLSPVVTAGMFTGLAGLVLAAAGPASAAVPASAASAARPSGPLPGGYRTSW